MKRSPRVFLVNPANVTVGISFITPRWLFVLAAATPGELVGNPILIDETIRRFDPQAVQEGDIVGIGITTDNCLPGYRVLREAKKRGATVIVGGIHTTIFPDEVLAHGADAIVTGNGDIVWPKAVADTLDHKLQKHYPGGRVEGDSLLMARWDLMKKGEYIFPSIQTVLGCPENCTFCSVWVTEGRDPRQRVTENIIQEVNILNAMGFPLVMFADDNFNPATLGRIARETSPSIRRNLERIREERLAFFEQYARGVDRILPSFTQMTSEVVSDPEYLTAMHDKMGIRGALIGVESFNEPGLKSTRKTWNPVGQKMVEVIQKIQASGIHVLSSIICGLETDTEETLHTMRVFAKESGTRFAQFTLYRPFPGTVDFHEMLKDLRNPEHPKHQNKLLIDRYWLDPHCPRVVIEHPAMSTQALLENIQKNWDTFYDPLQTVERAMDTTWPWLGKLVFVLISFGFRALYAGSGISADGARKKELNLLTRVMLKGAARLLALSLSKRQLVPRQVSAVA